MSLNQAFPGNHYQQSLLRHFAEHYHSDERVLAVLIYGSLGRGAEDAFSDFDIAVVIHNDVEIDIPYEIEQIQKSYTAIGEPTFFTESAGASGFLVMESLTCFDISYFKLDAMHPTLLAGFHLLTGALEREIILDKARANDRAPLANSIQIHKALWHLITVDRYLQRKHFWRALESLESARTTLMDIFATTHGGRRAHQIFEEQTTVAMREIFGRTLPHYVPDSVSASLRSSGGALNAALDILEYHLAALSNGEGTLGDGERALIQRLRARQVIRDGS